MLRAVFRVLAISAALTAHISAALAEAVQWLQFVPGGIEVRAITDGPSCPALQIDGADSGMTVRSSPGDKFPITVCSAPVPANARAVSVAGVALVIPAAASEPKRIAVIGDTGCRLKGDHIQACDDPAQWPFSVIAAAVAREKPDLVIHVGDYYYRETACPNSMTGCAGSPFGDNWAAWRADFFAAVGPLLTAAPWAFVRGNHEECSRGGEGWNRTLAPYAFDASAVCKTFEDPYVVKLANLTLAVVDVSKAREETLDQAQADMYRAQYGSLATITSGETWLLQHRPIWSPGVELGGHLLGDNKTLEVAAQGMIPSNITLILSGHHHLFQTLTYESDLPVQIVAGNGGDYLNLGSPTDPAGWVIEGVKVKSGVDLPGAFGFSMIEKQDNGWRLTNFDTSGAPHQTCTIAGRAADCTAK
jgi:hypothetical protein